jgi:hypothetical protein
MHEREALRWLQITYKVPTSMNIELPVANKTFVRQTEERSLLVGVEESELCATKIIPHAYISLKTTDLGYLSWFQKGKEHAAEKWR